MRHSHDALKPSRAGFQKFRGKTQYRRDNVTEQHKTHYRKAFDSPYLSAADIVDPITLTIRRVVLESDRTKKTKDDFNTCYWQEGQIRPGEPLKPMILNATNSKFLAQLTGSKWIDEWAGTAVTVWVDGAVRFGKETVEGLRLAKPSTRPHASEELLDAAREASLGGVESLRKWWDVLPEDSRELLVNDFRGLKAAAKAVDARKASGESVS
jgi:hypothetical protein